MIKFNDGSFLSLDKNENGEYVLILCGQKKDRSTTMSYVNLNQDQLKDLKNKIEKLLKN